MIRFFWVGLVVSSAAFGWGFDGHRKLASLMQEPLPQNLCLRQWFAARQTADWQDTACNPDRWRYMSAGAQYDPDEWPRHYLEIDWVTPTSGYPRNQSVAMGQLGMYFEQDGEVPWHVGQRYQQLVDAFRAKDETQILTIAFLLSHYVTDSFSLLHDTKNFDPNGLHSRWESDMLANSTHLLGITDLAMGTYLGSPGKADPVNNIFDIVITGNPLAAQLIAADQANPNDLEGLYNGVKDLTARRWGDALTVLASMLWSAWVDAGSPELPGFTADCSRAAPTGEIVIVGFPVAGGFTHPVDSGTGGGTGGSGGGTSSATGGGSSTGGGGGSLLATGGGSGGGGGATVERPGCNQAGGMLLMLVGALIRRRRRARVA